MKHGRGDSVGAIYSESVFTVNQVENAEDDANIHRVGKQCRLRVLADARVPVLEARFMLGQRMERRGAPHPQWHNRCAGPARSSFQPMLHARHK